MFYLPRILRKLKLSFIKKCNINKTSKISGRGMYHVNKKKYLYLSQNINKIECEISAFTTITSNCMIGGREHPFQRKSYLPLFASGRYILRMFFVNGQFQPFNLLSIANDIWIWCGSSIKSEIKIAKSLVIGMGSVVTKDEGVNKIWGDIPKGLFKERFSEEMIQSLSEIKWLELLKNFFSNLAKDIDIPVQFIKKVL